MTVREKMIEFRRNNNLTIKNVADMSRVSERLIEILEEGGTTTPKLVPQIAKVYGLDELESEELMAEHLRPHGNDYDPMRYVDPVDIPASLVDNVEMLKKLYENVKKGEVKS